MAAPSMSWRNIAVCVAFLQHSTAMIANKPHMLAVFQPRSRHTHGFQPVDGYDLPLLELRQLLPSRAELLTDRGGALCWIERADEADVRRACSRSILTHSSFSILASGASLREALAALRARLDLERLIVVDLARPHLTRIEAEEVRLEVATVIRELRELCKSAESLPLADTLLIDESRHFRFGTCLARGLAGGPGAPGSRPRRRYAGVLGQYALKERPFRVPTTMETELAFLMASLARVRPGARVLDPCCGSAGLLLCAAALGATDMLGLDTDAAALAGATRNFEAYGFAQPAFRAADIMHLEDMAEHDEMLSVGSFDAILCDPPYGMKVQVGAASRQEHATDIPGSRTATPPDEARAQVALLLMALLRLAARVLSREGRLVFFLPVRGADALPDGVDALRSLLMRLAPGELQAGLQLVDGRKQRFSPTFCRWIVIIQRG